MNNSLPKIIIIAGPTASGKTDIGIKLAQKFGGEIISADSRQVYKKLDLGTGKATPEEQSLAKHHLIDVVDPGTDFTVADFKQRSVKIIDHLTTHSSSLGVGKGVGSPTLPLIVGGTGLYIKSLVDNLDFNTTKPDEELRKKLNSLHLHELQKMLKKLNPKLYQKIDYNNSYRVIRAIEIAQQNPGIKTIKSEPKPIYNSLQLATKIDRDELVNRINIRVDKRVEQGMIEEVENLINDGVDPKWLKKIGLEYRYITYFLEGKLEKDEMLEKLKIKIRQFAKRQMTWFKKDKRIKWIDYDKYELFEQEVEKFIF